MTLRLSRGEYWLLEAVVEHALPLTVIALPDGPPWDRSTIDMSLNKTGHGLSIPALQQTLLRMQRLGWIVFQSYVGNDKKIRRLDAASVNHEMRHPTVYEERAYYRLSAKGGDVFEAFARPDWSRYLSHETDPVHDNFDAVEGAPEHLILRASDENNLRMYLHELRHSYLLDEKTIRRSALVNWSANYWKTLPSGFEVRCVATPIVQPPEASWRVSSRLDCWYRWR
jgi:hypothetical protein